MFRSSRLVIILAGLITLSSVATAFVLLNPHRRWFNLPRNVIVDNTGMPGVDDGDNGVTATRGAVEMWDNPSGADIIDILSTTTGAPNVVLGDGVSHLVFGDPFHVCTGNCLAANFTSFYTTSQTLDCNGDTLARITDSDTVFNTSYSWTTEGEASCSGEFYLEAVTGHEIGHLIGIGHSGNGSALMAPSVSSCFNKPLHQDDVEARDALYNWLFGHSSG